VSVLNQPNDGLFSVLIVLIRVLVRFGPKERNELILMCGAAADQIDSSHLTRTLNRWTELGLLSEEQEVITIAEPYRSALGKSAEVAEERLPGVARKVVMLPSNNLRFWESEGVKSADLSRGLAWMLAQDIYTLDSSVGQLAILENEQLLDSAKQTIFQNDTRRNGLRAWMPYLGFAREGANWFVDPTDALRDVLPQIFETREELSGPDFVSRAARVLPVLDGGAYRTQVEAALKESALPLPRIGLLSTSLSLALQRLDRTGAITLLRRSDTDGGVSLTGSNRRTWREVSHVILASAREMR
jgi:hypothetical protein